MSYVVTDSKAIETFKELRDVTLSIDEAALLIEQEKLIEKLLRKVLLAYQIDLMQGKMIGKEQNVYMAWEFKNNVMKAIKDLDTKIQEHKQK